MEKNQNLGHFYNPSKPFEKCCPCKTNEFYSKLKVCIEQNTFIFPAGVIIDGDTAA